MKKLICSKKCYIKLKKYSSTKHFFFKLYIWIWKNCVRDIVNLCFRDNVQNLKTRSVLKKYGPNKKMFFFLTKSIYDLILQKYGKIWSKLVHWLQRYKILKKIFVQFYMTSIYSKGIAHMKKVHQQNNFSFWFHVSVPNFS